MIQVIKEKIRTLILTLKTLGLSERLALVITFLSFALVLVIAILIINFILPKTRLEIAISGPETAKVGQEVAYTVTIKNIGNVILKNPELVFHYSSFSLPEKSLVQTERLEDLYPEEEKTFTFKSQLFGIQGERREFKAWLNYSTERKPTIMRSKMAYFSTVISEVPIDLVLELPQKVPIYPQNNSQFVFRIRYFSFVEKPISNLKLLVDFPSDFTFQESIPSATENREFEISKLEPLTGGEVEIAGTLPASYEIGKELKFNAKLLINLHGTDVLLKEDSAASVTYEPIFFFSQRINNDEKYLPYPGEKLYYQIYFKNIQDKPLRNLSLTTVLESPLFDLTTIETPLGTFAKGSNSISWTGEQIPELRYLTPGQQGKVEFWVTLKQDYQPKDLTETNFFIRNRVILAGFETEFRNRVNSLIKISQEGYYRDPYSFFEASGSHPPQINHTTSYTIVWKLENYYNPIENVKIKASLPKGISVKKVKVPKEGEINVSGYPTAPVTTPYPDIPADFRFEKPLYQGLKDDEVRYLQFILKKEVPYLYKDTTPVTGYFGPVTLNSLKGFQEKYKIPPTGVVDETTRLKLNELLAKIAPPSFGEVIWEIEKVDPGIGVLKDPLIAAFQIVFTPEISQRGKIATLINEVRVSAKDQWTDRLLAASDEAIDTTLPDDPTVYKRGGEIY